VQPARRRRRGRGLYELDLPNGGLAWVQGNVVARARGTQNATLVAFGAEGRPHADSLLVMAHNTLLSGAEAPAAFVRHWPERLPADTTLRIEHNLLRRPCGRRQLGPPFEDGNVLLPHDRAGKGAATADLRRRSPEPRSRTTWRPGGPMLDRIRACIPALPPAEQRVAGCCWPTRAASPRCRWASWPSAQVSKPTVVRFCRSVGYDGLADFKLKLAGSVNEGVPFVHRAVDEDDKAGDIVVKVVDNAVARCCATATPPPARRSSARSPRWPRPAATAGASSSTASATRASWRRTRSTSSSASACAPPPSATATCR
jgi:hypothetical protein